MLSQRKHHPHTSTSDLLTWSSEQLPPESSASASGHRSRQPSSDEIGEVLRRSQLTQEEAQSLTKKKPYTGSKIKEMTGSGIFSGNAEDTTSQANSANSKNRTSTRAYQQAMNGMSRIFRTEENISPKKSTSLPEIAKQRELSGTYRNESVTKINKLTSSAKTKELSGSDIFAPPSAIVPRSLASAHTLESKESKDTRKPVPQKVSTSAQVSNRAGGRSNFPFSEEPVKRILRKKIHEQKFAEMTGSNIFNRDVIERSPEKPSSRAKLREMAGSDIFSDGKAENRDNILGARRTALPSFKFL